MTPILTIRTGGRGRNSYVGYCLFAIVVVALIGLLGPRRGDPQAWAICASIILLLASLVIHATSLRVVITHDEVQCGGLLRFPQSMRRTEIGAVTRTIKPAYRGGYRHYITLTPKHPSSSPIDIRTDFIAPADVLSLWRELRGS